MKHVHGFWGAVRCWASPCAIARELQRRRAREIDRQRVEASAERIREWFREEDENAW